MADAEAVVVGAVAPGTLKEFDAEGTTPVPGFVDDDFDAASDDSRSSAVDAAPAKARYMAILPPPRMRGPTGVPAIVVPEENAGKSALFSARAARHPAKAAERGQKMPIRKG
ncbi:hypothetical protein CRBSH125_07800 [Afipia carboxidovorans]|nr:hypothetical protein CRBSH125_07800 [Afipia carboxidovorans]